MPATESEQHLHTVRLQRGRDAIAPMRRNAVSAHDRMVSGRAFIRDARQQVRDPDVVTRLKQQGRRLPAMVCHGLPVLQSRAIAAGAISARNRGLRHTLASQGCSSRGNPAGL